MVRMIAFGCRCRRTYGTNDSGFFGLGADTRWLSASSLYRIYFFDDDDHTSNSNNFIAVNLGIEFIMQRWDVHMNSYFSTQQKQKGTDLGYGNTYFYGLQRVVKSLPNRRKWRRGRDDNIGFLFSYKNGYNRVFASSYGYMVKATNIVGVQESIVFTINPHARVSLQQSYENVFHNKGLLKVAYTFGGIATDSADRTLAERVEDIIPRHLGSLNTAAGAPYQTFTSATRQLVSNNAWFFNSATSFQGFTDTNITWRSCTFNYPCQGLHQQDLNGIFSLTPDNARIYLSSGSYQSGPPDPAYTLHHRQAIFGRSTGFSQPAMDNNCPIIHGLVTLESNNVLDSLKIINDSAAMPIPDIRSNNVVGVFIPGTNTGSNLLHNLDITASDISNVFATGIYASGNSNTLFNNRVVSAIETETNSTSGENSVLWDNNTTFTVNNSTLNVHAARSGALILILPHFF